MPGRRAAAYVRAEVDSPMETRLRMLLVLAGLPEPSINVKIRAVDGEVLRRYDLSFPTVRVIVEYDGRQHIERVEAWESDLERREAIDGDGWRAHFPGHSPVRVHVSWLWPVLVDIRGQRSYPRTPAATRESARACRPSADASRLAPWLTPTAPTVKSALSTPSCCTAPATS